MLNAKAQKQIVKGHFQSTALFWNEVYQVPSLTGRIHQLRQAIVLKLVDRLQLLTGSVILVAGCGAGHEAVALGQRGYHVLAIDAVSAMVEQTRRHAAVAGVQGLVTASLGDVDHLPFQNHTFKLILAIGLVPWLQSPDCATREMARVLEPGGYVISTADSRWSIRQMLDPWHNPVLSPVKDGIRNFLWEWGLRRRPPNSLRTFQHSIKRFDTCLRAVGLNKIEGMTLGFGPFSFFGHRMLPDPVGTAVHDKLQALADRGLPVIRSAGNQYIVLAKKEPNITS